jgi:hypothetical protein
MRDIYLSISRMSRMLDRACCFVRVTTRCLRGSRVRIVRIAARCPRAKSRVSSHIIRALFTRRRHSFAHSCRAYLTCLSRVSSSVCA